MSSTASSYASLPGLHGMPWPRGGSRGIGITAVCPCHHRNRWLSIMSRRHASPCHAHGEIIAVGARAEKVRAFSCSCCAHRPEIHHGRPPARIAEASHCSGIRHALTRFSCIACEIKLMRSRLERKRNISRNHPSAVAVNYRRRYIAAWPCAAPVT